MHAKVFIEINFFVDKTFVIDCTADDNIFKDKKKKNTFHRSFSIISVRSNLLRFPPTERNNVSMIFSSRDDDEARATFRKSVVSRHRWRW